MAGITPSLTWHFSQTPGANSKPVVMLIHNFGGSEDHFQKHVTLLNLLGLDVITFDLSWHKNGVKKIFFRRLKNQWAKEITLALKEVKREIITFAFSGIGACTVDAVAEVLKKSPNAVIKMIFDSGPFDENRQCVRNMLQLYYGVKNPTLRKIFTDFMVFFWEKENANSTQESFKKILSVNPSIPMLSLIGARDKIVPQAFIKSCFAKASIINLTQTVFELGGHLTSYKEEPAKYKETLQLFLFN